MFYIPGVMKYKFIIHRDFILSFLKSIVFMKKFKCISVTKDPNFLVSDESINLF